MIGRLTISMDGMPQTVFLFCLTVGLFGLLSSRLQESKSFLLLSGATTLSVFALCFVGFINQPMFALGLSTHVIYAILQSRRNGKCVFTRDHLVGFGVPLLALGLFMLACLWLIVNSASGSQSNLIVYRKEEGFRPWFFDDLADPIAV